MLRICVYHARSAAEGEPRVVRGGAPSAADDELVACEVVPLRAARPGYRVVRLRDRFGSRLTLARLLVRLARAVPSPSPNRARGEGDPEPEPQPWQGERVGSALAPAPCPEVGPRAHPGARRDGLDRAAAALAAPGLQRGRTLTSPSP